MRVIVMVRNPAELDGAGDGRGAEAVAHVVQHGVERVAALAVEGEGELGGVVVEVADGDADERQAALLDHRHGLGQQFARRGEDRASLRRRLGQRV